LKMNYNMKTLTELTENQKMNGDLYVAYIGTSKVNTLKDLAFSATVDERCVCESIGDGAILTNRSPNSIGTNLFGVDIIHNNELIDVKHSSKLKNAYFTVSTKKQTKATHYAYYDIDDNAAYVAPIEKLTPDSGNGYLIFYKSDIKRNGVKYPSPAKYIGMFSQLYDDIDKMPNAINSWDKYEGINELQKRIDIALNLIADDYKKCFNQIPKIIVVENYKKI